jgi:hypothetical protein
MADTRVAEWPALEIPAGSAAATSPASGRVVRLGLVEHKGSCGSGTVWLGIDGHVVEMRFGIRRIRRGRSVCAPVCEGKPQLGFWGRSECVRQFAPKEQQSERGSPAARLDGGRSTSDTTRPR